MPPAALPSWPLGACRAERSSYGAASCQAGGSLGPAVGPCQLWVLEGQRGLGWVLPGHRGCPRNRGFPG
jgi:hypothetical protein